MITSPADPKTLLADADWLLTKLAEDPENPDRDHMTALATAHALTAIAAALVQGGA